MVAFVILLHQTLDDYVTLFQVYEHVINADKLRARIADGERHFRATHRPIVVDKREHLFTTTLKVWSWYDDATATRTWAEWSGDLADALASAGIPWTLEHATPPAMGRESRAVRGRQHGSRALMRRLYRGCQCDPRACGRPRDVRRPLQVTATATASIGDGPVLAVFSHTQQTTRRGYPAANL